MEGRPLAELPRHPAALPPRPDLLVMPRLTLPAWSCPRYVQVLKFVKLRTLDILKVAFS